VDQELKVYLDGKFAAVDGKFAEVRAEMRSGFEAVDVRFGDVRAEIEATETRLLSEFWKWGRTAEQRVRRMEHSDATTTDRLAGLEERIFTLERKAAGGKS
jgi:hypothetical protein